MRRQIWTPHQQEKRRMKGTCHECSSNEEEEIRYLGNVPSEEAKVLKVSEYENRQMSK
jgi:hypothetical protein